MRKPPFSYDDAIQLANEARERAIRRRDAIQAAVEYRNRTNPTRQTLGNSLAVLVDAEVSKDPRWRAHVNDNQWYLAQATAFGVGEVRDLLHELLTVMKEIRDDRRAAPADGRGAQAVEPSS